MKSEEIEKDIVINRENVVIEEIAYLNKFLDEIKTPLVAGKTIHIPNCIDRLIEIQQFVWLDYIHSPSLENEITYDCIRHAITISWNCLYTTPILPYAGLLYGIDTFFICFKGYVKELLMESERLYVKFNKSWFPGDRIRSLGLRITVQMFLNVLIEFVTNDKYLIWYQFYIPNNNIIANKNKREEKI